MRNKDANNNVANTCVIAVAAAAAATAVVVVAAAIYCVHPLRLLLRGKCIILFSWCSMVNERRAQHLRN